LALGAVVVAVWAGAWGMGAGFWAIALVPAKAPVTLISAVQINVERFMIKLLE